MLLALIFTARSIDLEFPDFHLLFFVLAPKGPGCE